MKRCPKKNLKLEAKLQWRLVLFLEHEILEQNLNRLNLRTHILFFGTQKLEKTRNKKKVNKSQRSLSFLKNFLKKNSGF
jgi:hypothetical protein